MVIVPSAFLSIHINTGSIMDSAAIKIKSSNNFFLSSFLITGHNFLRPFFIFIPDMAKQLIDQFTQDAFAAPRRGRPRKPDAMTGAQRSAKHRAKSKLISVPSNENCNGKSCGWCGTENHLNGCSLCTIGQRP